MTNYVLREYKDKVKKATGYTILGAFIKGVGKNIAYLDGITYQQLGESFCNFGEKIDVLNTNLTDTTRFNGSPETFKAVEDLMKLSYEKIDSFFLSAEGHNFNFDQVKSGLKQYGEKLATEASQLAFSEGNTDDDIKQDLRVLLKIGIDEFEKRNKEDEMAHEDDEANNVEELPQGVEDDSQYEDQANEEYADEPSEDNYEQDSSSPEDDYENENDDTSDDTQDDGVSDNDDYESLANDEFGEDENNNTEDEGASESSNFYLNQLLQASGFGENVSYEKDDNMTAQSEAINYTRLLKKGYTIKGLTKEEEKYLKSIATVGPANLWRWLTRWFSILGNKVLTHGRANNEIEWHADKDVNFIEGFGVINPENFIKFLIFDQVLGVIIGTLAHPFGVLLLPLNVGVAYVSFKIKEWVVKIIYENSYTAQNHIQVLIKNYDRGIEILDDLEKQALKKGDRQTLNKVRKMRYGFKKNRDDLETKWKTVNIYGESYDDFVKKIDNKNTLAKCSGDLRYVVRGELTSFSENELNDVVKDMINLEEGSFKAIGESNGYNFTDSDITRHKQILHTFALMNVIRHKCGK